MTHRHVVPLALVLGLLAAVASASGARAATTPKAPPAAPLPRPAAPAKYAVPDCGKKQNAPSGRLSRNFSILRRPHAAADTLPKDVVRQLQARGVRLPDVNAARLLRTTTGGGKAWVIPVADVSVMTRPFGCVAAAPAPAPLPTRAPRRSTKPRYRPAVPAPAPPPSALPALVTGANGILPALRPAKREEGLVVMATGDAGAGGGGALSDLLAGQAPPSVRNCVGRSFNLVSVSGMVPDGVDQVYLTKSDGTAVKSDVEDNGYSFVVPAAARRSRIGDLRFLVWTAANGVPKVQPVTITQLPQRFCRRMRMSTRFARFTPDVVTFTTSTVPVPATLVSPARAPRRP